MQAADSNSGAERLTESKDLQFPTAVSPDGCRVATAGGAGRVAVHNREGGLLQEVVCPLGGIYDLAFSADGKVLVAGCEQGFVAWDLPGPDRWAVRANPSSGNLHPVEGYVVTAGVDGLGDGVYHYQPQDHALAQRARWERPEIRKENALRPPSNSWLASMGS